MKSLTRAVFCIFAFTLCTRHAPALSTPPNGRQFQFLGQLTPSSLPRGAAYATRDEGVAVYGNRAVVTAGLFLQGEDEGRAFLYDLSNPQGIRETAVLRPSDNHAGNEFGWSAALSDRYLFIGAPGANNDRGAVYMYDLSDPLNMTERKIVAFDSAPHAHFGYSLAVDGNRLIVGAPKFSAHSIQAPSAYVVDFSNPSNMRQTRLRGLNTHIVGDFGGSVGIDGDIAIVGETNGGAYLFNISNPSNVLRTFLPTGGKHVAIDGDLALTSSSDGFAWATDFSDWGGPITRLLPRPTQIPPFGRGLDLAGTIGVIGAFNEDGSRGAIYVYDFERSLVPVRLQRIPQPSDSSQVFFGHSIDFDGRTAIVGSFDATGAAQKAFLFQLVPEPHSLSIFAVLTSVFVCRNRFCRSGPWGRSVQRR
jgi:hypothetical protein